MYKCNKEQNCENNLIIYFTKTFFLKKSISVYNVQISLMINFSQKDSIKLVNYTIDSI